MSIAVAVLTGVVLCDLALSGFRTAQGRTGRLPTTRGRVRASVQGLLVGMLLVGPPVALGVAVTTGDEREAIARAALLGCLWLAAPTLVALVGVVTLPWRWRYLAMAVVLGPMTFLRPVAAVLTGVLAALAAPDGIAATLVALATAGLLATEPLLGSRQPGPHEPAAEPEMGYEV